MKPRLVLPLIALLSAPMALAADAARDAAVKAISELAPQATIESVEAAPVAGFQQVLISGQVIYVSNDGRYILQGSLFDTVERRDLTSERMDRERKLKLATLTPDRFISFTPDKPKYHVTVFTDIDCGYCRQMHSHIDEYKALGIQVDYLFFPRAGMGSHSFDKAVSVWCADDRNAAMTAAKAGQDPKPATCPNPVADDYQFGQQIGVDGTPAIYTDQGVKVGGYLPPEQLLARLEQAAAADKQTAGN